MDIRIRHFCSVAWIDTITPPGKNTVRSFTAPAVDNVKPALSPPSVYDNRTVIDVPPQGTVFLTHNPTRHMPDRVMLSCQMRPDFVQQPVRRQLWFV
jgi:hypothetical protein